MNRIDDYKRLTDRIVTWIYDYCSEYNIKSLVVGVSGESIPLLFLLFVQKLVFQLM